MRRVELALVTAGFAVLAVWLLAPTLTGPHVRWITGLVCFGTAAALLADFLNTVGPKP